MPTFDFQCKKCSAIFEFARPFGSDKHPPCPKCKSKRTEKLLTPPVIQFKGKGFYKTDARPHPPAPSPPSTGSGQAERGGEPSTKKELEKKAEPMQKPAEGKAEAPSSKPQ